MTIDDILMRKGRQVIRVGPRASVLEAVRLMAWENIGSAVVAEPGALLGILTERDVLGLAARSPLKSRAIPVRAAMTRDVLVGQVRDPVPLVMETMALRRIRHLPVLDRGELAGMVSMGDLVHALLREVESETRELRTYISLFLEPSSAQGSPPPRRWHRGRPSPPTRRAPRELTAGQILERKGVGLVAVPPTTTLASAVRTMVERGIGSLLVTEGRKVRGIVTERDVLRSAARFPEGHDHLEVQEVMSPDVVACAPEDGVGCLMQVMTRNRVRHLPVARGGALQGILSMRDLVQSILQATQVENRSLRDRIHGRTGGSGGLGEAVSDLPG